MNKADILSIARQQLSDAICQDRPPICDPLQVSPWIAMSLMQKAIRRGEERLALRAASTLLHVSPERLWRRCGCITFEDVGVADLDTVAIVTAALAGKRFRASMGGEWRVASFIVSRMVHAPKCRAADDLLLAAENHRLFEGARTRLASRTTDELMHIATGADLLPIRALAAWYAVGTDRRASPCLKPRRGDPTAIFNALQEASIPTAVIEIAREGYRRVGEVLCPFVALLWPLRQEQTATAEDDDFPPEVMVGDVPGWAYDVYSREGRAVLANFIEGRTETARWVRDHIPPRQRVAFLGGIVFRVFRHGLRAAELVDLRWDQVELGRNAALHVRRVKQGLPSVHPLPGDEMRALRELKRTATSPFVFTSERGAPFTTAGLAFAARRHLAPQPSRLASNGKIHLSIAWSPACVC
jgi:hypothetical protein